MEMSERKGRRGSQTGKTERRGNEIMENWSRESGMKSGGEEREELAALP